MVNDGVRKGMESWGLGQTLMLVSVLNHAACCFDSGQNY